jgi:hypothetical protein
VKFRHSSLTQNDFSRISVEIISHLVVVSNWCLAFRLWKQHSAPICIFPTCATSPINLILFDLIALTRLGEGYKLWSSSLYYFAIHLSVPPFYKLLILQSIKKPAVHVIIHHLHKLYEMNIVYWWFASVWFSYELKSYWSTIPPLTDQSVNYRSTVLLSLHKVYAVTAYREIV